MGVTLASPIRSTALLGFALLAWLVLYFAGLWATPVGDDGAYYLSHARYVSRRLIPYADFPSPYAPGTYYVNALLGEHGLADPVLCKLPMYLAHVISLVLVMLILKKFGFTKGDGVFFGLVFGLWIMICDGQSVLLEPFANAFILMSFCVLLLSRSLLHCILAGLAVGAALMMKQLALPVVIGDLVLILSGGLSSTGWVPRPCRFRLIGACGFLACCSVPFFLFVLATHLPLAETLIHVVGFGGQTDPYGNAFNPRYLFDVFVVRSPHALLPLYLCFFLGLWFLMADKTVEWRAIVSLFWLFSAELLVAPFGHYAQLAVPWGVMLIAGFCKRHNWGTFSPAASNVAMLILVLLWFVPGTLRTLRESVSMIKQQPAQAETRLAAEVRSKLPSRENVLVINAPWLYYAADVAPPGRNHRMTYKTDDIPPWAVAAAKTSEYAVLLSQPVEYPAQVARRLLESQGLELFASLPDPRAEAASGKGTEKPEVLLYRRAVPR
jgi:hypothetical protein